MATRETKKKNSSKAKPRTARGNRTNDEGSSSLAQKYRKKAALVERVKARVEASDEAKAKALSAKGGTYKASTLPP